jgi:hypothetical protein
MNVMSNTVTLDIGADQRLKKKAQAEEKLPTLTSPCLRGAAKLSTPSSRIHYRPKQFINRSSLTIVDPGIRH